LVTFECNDHGGLTAQGFAIGPGRFVVSVELQNLCNDFRCQAPGSVNSGRVIQIALTERGQIDILQ
jgi:hypothetical protein